MLTAHTGLESTSTMRRQRPVATSQTRSVSSKLHETASRPSGVSLTDLTSFLCPSNVRRQRPVATSQTLSVLSVLPDTASRASGVMLTACTPSVCACSVRRQRPVATSHTRSVLSVLPDTASRASGVMLTAHTASVCPPSVRRQRLPRGTIFMAAAICRAPRSFSPARIAASASRARAASSSPRSISIHACKYGASQAPLWLTHTCASLVCTRSSAIRPSCQSSNPWL